MGKTQIKPPTGNGSTPWAALDLKNNWVNFNIDAWDVAEYRKTDFTNVHVRGMIKDGITSPSTNIATLPEGFRPLKHLAFITLSNDLLGRVDIKANGVIKVQIADPTFIFMDMKFSII